MIEALATGLGKSSQISSLKSPAAMDVNQFKSLLQAPEAPPSALTDFVNSAENRVERGQLAVSSKLKEFDMKDNVMSLVNAMHESTMNSVSVQLTSKIGTKVTDSFEQLIKQQ